jgi:hypothetical protein
MEKEFVRVRSVRDIVIAAAMTALGIILIIMPTSVSVNILGTCLAVPGVLLLLFMKTDYKDTATGDRFAKRLKYFQASKKSEILNALKSDPSGYEWKEDESNNNGIMLEIYSGKNGDKAFVRASEFIPYSYVPCSEWFTFTKDKLAALLK